MPRSRLPAAMARVEEVAREFGIAIANVFHAGDGNLHPALLFDRRYPDQIERTFKAGDEKNALFPQNGSNLHVLPAIANVHLSRLTDGLGFGQLNLGSFKITNIDEARDQWSHKFARGEQVRLLRSAGRALVANRAAGTKRGLIFVLGLVVVLAAAAQLWFGLLLMWDSPEGSVWGFN